MSATESDLAQTLIDIREKINAYDRACEYNEYTDVEDVWAIFYEIRDWIDEVLSPA